MALATFTTELVTAMPSGGERRKGLLTTLGY